MTVLIGAESLLIKGYVAEGEIPPGKFVKPGTAPGSYTVATAGSDKIFGVSAPDYTMADGEVGDVIHAGLAPVQFSGTVEAADFLTADANGDAVMAQSGDRFGAISRQPALQGDVATVFLVYGAA